MCVLTKEDKLRDASIVQLVDRKVRACVCVCVRARRLMRTIAARARCDSSVCVGVGCGWVGGWVGGQVCPCVCLRSCVCACVYACKS